MKIDCIIQSTNYADMLSLTLPVNKKHFDHIAVWTKRGDEDTKRICANNGVTCIETDRFSKGGSKFNRGAVYNEAFHLMVAQGRTDHWQTILDSDIVLPNTFRADFESLPPNPEYFYGARRYNVETLDQYIAVRSNFSLLSKLLLYRGIGYGYLQIINPQSSTFNRLWYETNGNAYPEFKDGSTADWVFRNAWGDCPWNPPTQPPDHILDHSIPEPVDPPTGLLRKLPFNVIHLGVTGVGAEGRGAPMWDVK